MQINKTAMHNTIELTLDAIALSFIFNKKAIILSKNKKKNKKAVIVQMQAMYV